MHDNAMTIHIYNISLWSVKLVKGDKWIKHRGNNTGVSRNTGNDRKRPDKRWETIGNDRK